MKGHAAWGLCGFVEETLPRRAEGSVVQGEEISNECYIRVKTGVLIETNLMHSINQIFKYLLENYSKNEISGR